MSNILKFGRSETIGMKVVLICSVIMLYAACKSANHASDVKSKPLNGYTYLDLNRSEDGGAVCDNSKFADYLKLYKPYIERYNATPDELAPQPFQYLAHCKINEDARIKDFCLTAVSKPNLTIEWHRYWTDDNNRRFIDGTNQGQNRTTSISSELLTSVKSADYKDENFKTKNIDVTRKLTQTEYVGDILIIRLLFAPIEIIAGGIPKAGGPTYQSQVGWEHISYDTAKKEFRDEFRDGVYWTSPSKRYQSFTATCEKLATMN